MICLFIYNNIYYDISVLLIHFIFWLSLDFCVNDTETVSWNCSLVTSVQQKLKSLYFLTTLEIVYISDFIQILYIQSFLGDKITNKQEMYSMFLCYDQTPIFTLPSSIYISNCISLQFLTDPNIKVSS